MAKSDAVPTMDLSKRNDKFIWDFLAFDLTDDDFEAIQTALLDRIDTIEDIKASKVSYRVFDKAGMYQPRPVSDVEKDGAIRYANWSCAMDILLVISKYCEFYDNKIS